MRVRGCGARAQPVALADGTVGALTARIPAVNALPDWGTNRVVALANREGEMLALRPVMNGVSAGTPLAERFGLNPIFVASLANGGGGATPSAAAEDPTSSPARRRPPRARRRARGRRAARRRGCRRSPRS